MPDDVIEKKVKPVFDDLGPSAPPFEEYFLKHIGYIKQVQSMLQESLDDSPAIMDKQVREIEAHGCNLKSVLAWADSYLDLAEHLALSKMPARSSDWTDMDREKTLSAAVVRQRRFRDVVKGLCEGIQARVSYAQTRLRAFSSAESQTYHP